jgi:uncharacterized protein involved in response to NO
LAGRAAGQTRSSGRTAIWPPYIRASLALAATAGFSLGAALFAASTLGFPLGPWWPAAAQAHGHVQRFGWAGLMVLGVGLHFLPRLRGTTLERPERARYALALLVTGLVTRALSQPLLALANSAPRTAAPYAGRALARPALLSHRLRRLLAGDRPEPGWADRRRAR